jgi:N-acetylglucosamine kinase-like BadF-type ATPase
MYLGIDGGGTKTAFVALDPAGRLCASHEEPTSSYLEVGLVAAAEVLRKGALAVLGLAGATADDVQFAFVGLPAYGEDSGLLPRLDRLPAGFLPVGRFRCGNDMVCGWAGSLAGRDGIGVVAGTGSIAYGEYAGRRARAGGWGDLFGDEGSAFWIAREGLRLFSRMSDGRAARGPLYDLLRERFELEGDLDLCAHVYGPPPPRRGATAQLAKLICEAARKGDQQAAAIFERAAGELAELVCAVRRGLLVPAGAVVEVSYSGGVFNSGELIREPLQRALETGCGAHFLTAPELSPAVGAALYAARCCGHAFGPDALASLAGWSGSAG